MGLLLAADRGPVCKGCETKDVRRPLRMLRAVHPPATDTVFYLVCEVCDSPRDGALPTWAFRSRQK